MNFCQTISRIKADGQSPVEELGAARMSRRCFNILFGIGSRSLLFGCALTALAATGCQTDIGGQTMPSAYYLRDDVQYFPAGPEFLLPNQVKATQEYNAERADLRGGLADDGF